MEDQVKIPQQYFQELCADYKEHNKEDLDVFVKEVDKIKTKKSNKIKFILIHSPNFLINESSYINTKKKMQDSLYLIVMPLKLKSIP